MKNDKMPTSDSYNEYLIKSLKKEPDLAAAYITATLEEQDPEPSLLKSALTDIAEALGEQNNMVPEQVKQHQEKLDVLLAQRADEALYHLAEWLEALGLKLTVKVAHKQQDIEANIHTSLELTVAD